MPDKPNLVVLRDGEFDTANGGNAESLKTIFAGFAEKRPERLVLHFHGGLVSRQIAIASATRLAPEFSESGAASLFVVWESGAVEVISQKLEQIFKEDLFQTIHVKVSQFVKAKLEKLLKPEGARGPGLPLEFDATIQDEIDKGPGMFADIPLNRIPADAVADETTALSDDEQAEIERRIDRDPTVRSNLAAIEATRVPEPAGGRGADAVAPKTTLMDEEVLRTLVPAEEKEGGKFALSTIMLGKHIVWVVGAVIWRFAKRRDHGIYLTIVEEILREFYVRTLGRLLWVGMKEGIEHAFKPGNGGTALVDELQKLWQAGARPCVTLVGHSAGSIYVARILRALHEKMNADFHVNVALIAPACTFAYLAPALREAKGRVANLRIFGMGDAFERKDAIAGPLYPASLLYFVSGVLEDNRDEPLAGMERYYSAPYDGDGFEDIAAVKQQAALLRPHAYAWSNVAGHDGANCDMTSHGGWADAKSTLASIKFLVRQGYDHA